MEVEDIQSQPTHKFSSRIIATTNGHSHGQLISAAKLPHHFPPDEDDAGVGGAIKRQAEIVSNSTAAAGIEAMNSGGPGNRIRGWHHSSRIIRVSRASGGKDRHSKVWTSKGLRDRRVRLSVSTAIQFYDLQDRLGYDQPSKAVEWLINAATEAISELPSLNSSACFPDTPKQLSDEKRGAFDSAADVAGIDDSSAGFHHQLSLSKSACSSTSETSKGSGLSLSRPDARVNRVKARERARERAAKDKEKESSGDNPNPNPMNSMGQNSTFTELLTSGINNVNNNNNNNNSSGGGSPVTVAQMDYFATGLLNLSSTPSTTATTSSRSHHQIHMGNSSLSLPMTVPMPFGIGLISGSGDVASSESMHHHFPFTPEQHMFPIASAATASSDYSLNFSIGGGIAGFNRGTLQSNSSQQQHSIYNNHHHLQRFSNPALDHGATAANNSSIPFFFGTAAPQPMEHQFAAGFDGRLQLCYSDGTRHPDPNKGKGKN